jgi:hypothetical protein
MMYLLLCASTKIYFLKVLSFGTQIRSRKYNVLFSYFQKLEPSLLNILPLKV